MKRTFTPEQKKRYAKAARDRVKCRRKWEKDLHKARLTGDYELVKDVRDSLGWLMGRTIFDQGGRVSHGWFDGSPRYGKEWIPYDGEVRQYKPPRRLLPSKRAPVEKVRALARKFEKLEYDKARLRAQAVDGLWYPKADSLKKLYGVSFAMLRYGRERSPHEISEEDLKPLIRGLTKRYYNDVFRQEHYKATGVLLPNPGRFVQIFGKTFSQLRGQERKVYLKNKDAHKYENQSRRFTDEDVEAVMSMMEGWENG